jgi:predicted ATPase
LHPEIKKTEMNTIGFSNFRRFASFPEMDLGDITLLVGGNNSGKSTLVKALLLCIDNARLMTSGKEDNSSTPQFRFDANEWHDVKVKTFSRAIHNKPAPSLDKQDGEPSLPTKMRFTFTLGAFKFVLTVSGDRDKDEVTGNIDDISIEDRGNMVQYTISYTNKNMSYSVLGSTTERETLVKKLYKDYVSAKEMLDSLAEAGDDIAAISAQNEKVASLEKQIEEFVNPDGEELPEDFDYEQALKKQFREFFKTSYTSTTWDDLPLENYNADISENLLVHAIGNFIGFAKNPGLAQPSGDEDAYDYKEWEHVQNARKALYQDIDKIRKSQFELASLLDSIGIEYITAHAANQNTIYNTADRNDYIAQTVHEFVRAKIVPGEEEFRFVTEWMKNFGIGSSFEIIPIDGEAYRVKIKDEEGYEVNLADKGMGSIQLMILLLRLAAILREYGLQKSVDEIQGLTYPTIILEEPEQNLHPKVQSQLAELFRDINKDYHCKFIVETHSEYLIRNTQVIVAEKKFEDEDALKESNPFMVYYFDVDNEKEPYYKMEYRTDGKFSNEFGPGFFDTAADLAFKLF